jgi:hypothetical protein
MKQTGKKEDQNSSSILCRKAREDAATIPTFYARSTSVTQCGGKSFCVFLYAV